jgi:hypothetical protein
VRIGVGTRTADCKVDVRPYEVKNTPIIAPNNGNPVLIDMGSAHMYTITVAMDGMKLSANYRETKRFKPSELIVGDGIVAMMDRNTLILYDNAKKEVKSKIVRREHAE